MEQDVKAKRMYFWNKEISSVEPRAIFSSRFDMPRPFFPLQ